MHKTPLLLSLLLAHGVAFAAPRVNTNDDINISIDRGQIDRDWDDKEYDWWKDNCREIDNRSSRIRLDCDKIDNKYRDHDNRSIHNPGKGHDKQDWDDDKVKYKEKGNGNGKGKNK